MKGERTRETWPDVFCVRSEKPAGPNGSQPSRPSPNSAERHCDLNSPRNPRKTASPAPADAAGRPHDARGELGIGLGEDIERPQHDTSTRTPKISVGMAISSAPSSLRAPPCRAPRARPAPSCRRPHRPRPRAATRRAHAPRRRRSGNRRRASAARSRGTPARRPRRRPPGT